MCYWGNGCAGKILTDGEKYSAEYKIVVNNEKLKDNIIKIIKEYDWKSEIKFIAMRKIKQHHIVNILKKIYSKYQIILIK